MTREEEHRMDLAVSWTSVLEKSILNLEIIHDRLEKEMDREDMATVLDDLADLVTAITQDAIYQ